MSPDAPDRVLEVLGGKRDYRHEILQNQTNCYPQSMGSRHQPRGMSVICRKIQAPDTKYGLAAHNALLVLQAGLRRYWVRVNGVQIRYIREDESIGSCLR